MSDALPDLRQPLTDDERTRAACDWSDYRKDYGVSADPAVRALEHTAFISGWTARHQETQSAYKDETLAALALATVNSEDRAAEAAVTIATQAEEIRHLEADERIAAWHRLAEHPALASCYGQDRPLIDAVMDRLEKLARFAADRETLPSDEEVLEYGFVLDSPQVAGLMAVTRNPMIAEVMSAARPEQPTFQRPWTPWTVVPGKEGR